MRKTIITAAAAILLLGALPVRADEGMWLPCLISQRIEDMQAKGFKLDAEDIYSINKASLKDAVVLFGSGCTGEVVSPDGLIFTNHHCGYSFIQRHSSVEHDYLKDGFWAMERSEELPNPGLSVSFLERMEDVTDIVLKGGDVRANCRALEKEAAKDGTGLRAKVEPLYHANRYYLFVYREYRDIRLVGAPPSSIGKFGGDTDNWMWPRHTGDFAIFRIYADKDGTPAEYSADNVPYTPKNYLKINRKGVQPGDFTMVFGFPGRTNEYAHSAEVAYTQDISDPMKIDIRTQRLAIQKKYMAQEQKIRIQYSAKSATIANGWKKWQGEVGGLRRNGILERKRAFEAGFEKWAKGTAYEGLTDRIAAAYDALVPARFTRELYQETAAAFELGNFAGNVFNALKKDGTVNGDGFFKNWYEPVDRECFIVEMTEFGKRIPEGRAPAYYTAQMKKYGSAEAWANALFKKTLFTSNEKVNALTAKDTARVKKDPVYVFASEFSAWAAEITPEYAKRNAALAPLMKEYMKAQMEYQPEKEFYPDANLTLRVAYGKVQGYRPSDAIDYYPVSTLKGIIEKDNPEIFDYNIPQALRDIYAEGGHDAQPVCFLATNHTTGGNSGSPVLDAGGNLVGINFDRVWEGTMSDLAFDPSFCRNISLDVRYLLFVIEHIGKATRLIDEMTFVE